MARIERVEVLMVDLVPKVKRTDAIQAFTSQETPIVRVFTDDGLMGAGYSYTIGTGGRSVVELIHHHLAPQLIGRDPAMVEQIWKGLFFHNHATAVGAITALALAAVDTALWDLRCRRAGLPLHVMAGGAQDRVPLYSTEGGWLHVPTEALIEDAIQAKARHFGGCKIKVGRPHVAEDVPRLEAVREAVGAGFEIMVDANQAFTVDEAIRRARHFEPLDLACFEEPMPAEDLGGHVRLSAATTLPVAVGESMHSISHFREYLQRDACSIVQVDVARIGGITPWLKTAHLGIVQRAGLPALPHGAARGSGRRRAERPLGRVHPAARRHHNRGHAHRGRLRRAVSQARARHRMGLGAHPVDAGRGHDARGHGLIRQTPRAQSRSMISCAARTTKRRTQAARKPFMTTPFRYSEGTRRFSSQSSVRARKGMKSEPSAA
jgi:L-alanine-DL-glutamate epimerase-like enolase superfamily enzyme